ncbi:MAG: GAF domain-containing protein [Desulfobacterales bacterium]|nr:GAF domain-containing protein [Desulfobacterales bacterium]
MKKQTVNYETLLKITNSVSHSRDPEEIVVLTVESMTHALGVKGCTIFLTNPRTNELEIAGSYGLSQEYLDKGPVSAIHSIADSLNEGPVAIEDVSDDPRIQYPEEAKKEGITSILSVPMTTGGRSIGAMRIYTAEPGEFELEDVNFIQAVANMTGMAIEMARLNKGLKDSIEVLKTMRDPRTRKSKRRTPYEGVPRSFSRSQL